MATQPKQNSSPLRRGVYKQISEISEEAIRCSAAFTGLITPTPKEISPDSWLSFKERYSLLKSWQETSFDIIIASMQGQTDPGIAASFLGGLPNHVGWEHHRKIVSQRRQTPVFFRTDQTLDGTIIEVQCPGSLWGVQEIIREFYLENNVTSVAQGESLSASFCTALNRMRPEGVRVHHLLDNSSHPAGERFFIQRARRRIKYFGFDVGVRPRDCNFVRGHDFLALLAENFAAERIQRLLDGDSIYDLPPVAFFDQKLLLALPFLDETRNYYSDAIHELFPYTTMLTLSGLRFSDGTWLTIEQFARLPRRQRAYFLKYAGADVGRNWGSRSVFHLGKLSRESCESLLNSVLERYDMGERWIIQREQPSQEEVSYITRDDELAVARTHSKYSIFYGPEGPMASLLMYENFYKVHGSAETITTIGIPQPQMQR